jgi:hypothetical protein
VYVSPDLRPLTEPRRTGHELFEILFCHQSCLLYVNIRVTVATPSGTRKVDVLTLAATAASIAFFCDWALFSVSILHCRENHQFFDAVKCGLQCTRFVKVDDTKTHVFRFELRVIVRIPRRGNDGR